MDTSQKSSKKLKQPSQARSKENGSCSNIKLKASDEELKVSDEAELKGQSRARRTADTTTAGGATEGRERTEWIAEVSHELRLPIANIKLLVETLLDGALDEPQVAKRMLSRAKTEVDRLQSLVVNLLSIESVSNSREVYCEWMVLEPKVKAAVETVNKLALEKSIDLRVEIADGFRIYANSAQLDQVVLNLLENAIKFTAAGGSVVIRSGSQPGSFSVTDTGIGMPAHEIPKIFERFYRIDRAQSKGSTGLGLSIVKHIVDMHGAKINVVSKEGSGSTFTLEFPGPSSKAGESR